MAKQYNSFVIRTWQLDGGGWRIVIEHVQSGEQTRIATLGAALDWLCERAVMPSGATGESNAPRGQEGASAWEQTKGETTASNDADETAVDDTQANPTYSLSGEHDDPLPE